MRMPGPCHYNAREQKSKANTYISQLADRGLYILPNYTPGPGSYTVQKSHWKKRSFNIKYINDKLGKR